MFDEDDPYTSEPNHLRIYWEETGDRWKWHLDGADQQGRYTEEVRRFETHEQAVASIPEFVEESGVRWRWQQDRPRTRINPMVVGVSDA
jgi:hypothetical protein